MNLIMYEPNIYVNNGKFILILIMSAFFNYLRALGSLFIPPKICPELTVFNNISSVVVRNIYEYKNTII